ncbi:hypothetical protein BFP72_00650 [Reichenbachiella sp. 5M10]|uniref:chondroitinase-B domain-containing protein n=1 Tax=Reichenbachiella sp. 5M10 TaxID=1889772 RepID=UPI000C147616|nr:chondroitinase-B domain-containing protein [Reichenbachiella sp. 5M10]PIB34042.1 hypothetical protein BFP72_00650 [Reichenbachiella sp. 5M10]
MYTYKTNIQKNLSLVLLCLMSLAAQAQGIKTTVSTIDDLKDQIETAQPGDTLVLAIGSYDDGSISIKDLKGTDDAPIVIMAESIGATTLTGGTKFVLSTSEHLIIHGFTFTNSGTAIKLEGSNNIRITRNTFDLQETSSTKWVYIGGVWDQPTSSLSHHNRIDHNTFQNKVETGHYITIDGSGETIQSQFDLIDHNHFKNNGPRATNEKESIRVGWSEMSESSGYTTIEFNFFETCNGDPEIISIKSCDNIVRHNTITRSEGTISLRHGNRNRIEGNYIFGGDTACSTDADGTYCSGGIRIYGEDHVIINNYIEGIKGSKWDAPITLTEGDAESGNSSLSKHFRIERAIIAYNTLVNNDHGIEIGFDNNGKYSKPPRDVVMAYNVVTGESNELIKFHNAPDNMVWVDNVMNPTGSAVLTADASQTFTDSEILVSNPNLAFDNTDQVWKSTANTPTYETNTEVIGTADEDVEGKTRGAVSTVGAHAFNQESVRYLPLTAADVGPTSYHPDYDGETEIDHLVLSTQALSYGEAAGEATVEITTNLDWTASTTDAWISITPTSDSESATLTISTTANPEIFKRQGTVTLSAGALSNQITVTQDGKDPGGEQLDVIAVTASAEQVEADKNNGKENVLDGDLSTLWASEGEQSITLDLGVPQFVHYLKIGFGKGDSRESYYEIALSMDGTTFTTVVKNGKSSGTTAELEIIDLEDTEAQYVRLIGSGNTSNNWNSITEMEVWGLKEEIPLETHLLKSITVYPVPSSGQVQIDGLTSSYTHYQILGLTGQKIIEASLQDDSIDISTLAKGIWALQLTGSNQPTVTRLIVKE